MRLRNLTLIGAALMIAGPMALAADAASSYNARGNVNQDVDWSVTWSCNNKSASVAAAGVRHVGLGRLKAHFRGANGVEQTADIDTAIDVNVAGGYTTSKSPNDMGAGGNPYIWFQAEGAQNSILLGRCNEASSKQLLKKFQTRNAMALASLADVGATGCNNAGGPDIAVGKRDQGAMKGRVWFSNQNSVDPAHRTAGTDAYGSMSMSMSASVKKGGAHAGVTGNPYVRFAFGVDLDGNGKFEAVDANTFGVAGEYYTADGTWTSDLESAYSPAKRCTDLGR